MKKTFTIFLSLVLMLTLTACSKNENIDSATTSSDVIVNSNTSTPSGSDETATTDNSSQQNGNTIFFESNISQYAKIEFKDQNENVLLNAADIAKVYAMQNVDMNYVIQIDFTTDGAKKFETATRENLGKAIKIYIDGELATSPVVYDTITDGKAIIDFPGTKEDMLKIYEKLTRANAPQSTTLPLPDEATKFYFSSGAGAWGTELTLNKSGEFSGNFHDSEMGINTEEYPDGTVYISVFNGKFTKFEKINDYSYKMTLTSIETRDKVETEWIEDQIRYVATTPYGLDDGTEFILYLPDTPISELSEDFLYWWPLRFEHNKTPKTTLSCYGILNVATNDGFFTAE